METYTDPLITPTTVGSATMPRARRVDNERQEVSSGITELEQQIQANIYSLH